MANPQPTDAHLRVAHSINEAIMMRDFTKRQRKVLDLILRLSWGCGKKEAYIPRQRDFGVVGVGEGHIKAELDWLVESKIIITDGDLYSFQKDFDQWQVSRIKPFAPRKLTELVKLNLNHTYQNGKFSNNELTETVSQNLPKQEVPTYQNRKFPTPNLALPKEKGGGEERGHPPIKKNNKERDIKKDKETIISILARRKAKEQGGKLTAKQHWDIVEQVDQARKDGKTMAEILSEAKNETKGKRVNQPGQEVSLSRPPLSIAGGCSLAPGTRNQAHPG